MTLAMAHAISVDPIAFTIDVVVGAWQTFKVAVQETLLAYKAESHTYENPEDNLCVAHYPTLARYQDLMAQKRFHRRLSLSVLAGVGSSAVICLFTQSLIAEIALASSLSGLFGISMYLRTKYT